MDIRIIKNAASIKGKILGNKKILQTEEMESEYPGVNSVRMYMFDLENNMRKEIAPGYEKYSFYHIVNLKRNPTEVYYTAMEKIDREKIRIHLHKYDADSSVDEVIYTFMDDITLYEEYKRVKLFIFNAYYFLMQDEYMRYNLAETYKGYFEFEQFLYNVRDKKYYEVKDECFRQHGIKKMVPVSDKTCLIKTGYSMLKDNRYHTMEKSEAVPEGIHLVDMGQMVAGIVEGIKNIPMDTIEQSFYKSTIPYVKIRDQYIIYSKVNNELHEEEVVFYNYKDHTKKVCINKNIYEMKDMVFTLTIKGKPYIMLMNSKGTQFLNMEKNKVDLMFSVEEPVQSCTNGMFIVKRKSKGMFGKDIYHTEVYKYPKLNLIHKEKGECAECMSTAPDNLYLLMKK